MRWWNRQFYQTGKAYRAISQDTVSLSNSNSRHSVKTFKAILHGTVKTSLHQLKGELRKTSKLCMNMEGLGEWAM